MERASRLQLQQHANSAQPSVTGGIESRPSGHDSGRPWRKVDRRLHDSKNLGSYRSTSQNIAPKTQTFRTGSQQLGPTLTYSSSQNLGQTYRSAQNLGAGNQIIACSHSTKSQTLSPSIRLSDLYQRDKIGSQQNVKMTRFQLEREHTRI